MSSNNQYYRQGGNPQYYYPQGNQQYYQQDPWQSGSSEEEDEGLNINIAEWLFTFLHYWYLFVIAIAIALGMAMLKNRRWIPTYYSQGTIVIKESSTYGGSASMLMQGFGVDAGYKNVNNQMIMLGSYDLMSRVVDSLPYLNTEYITQGRFKTRQLYHTSPITVEYTRLDPQAYGVLFQVDFEKDGSLHLSSTNENIPLTSDKASTVEPSDTKDSCKRAMNSSTSDSCVRKRKKIFGLPVTHSVGQMVRSKSGQLIG